MESSTIREEFFKFFEERGHVRLPSAPLVLKDDPSVLFTSAGMQPLVPYFTGKKQAPAKRIVTVQKVLRTSDIEEVGRDAYHQTFWEMLGNFSIGDYFKRESLEWSWQLLTGPFGFDGDRLVATVHEKDDEAYDIWTKDLHLLPPERVFRLGDEANFWAPGPTGLCGPDSEIFIDKGPQPGVAPHDPCDPSENCGRYVEIWNNVFQQYDRQADGTLVPLPKKNIDTGAGLERIAQVLQGVPGDTFRTDLFKPLVEKIEQLAGVKYGDGTSDLAIRIIVEHSRAATFLIADGIEPSNENRGYVLRRLIRRAALHGRRLGLKTGTIAQLGILTTRVMQAHYHELGRERDRIAATLEAEEQKFDQTLSSGIEQLSGAIASARSGGRRGIDGDTAFRLYDTFGFPIEMTREIAGSAGLDVDERRYRELLEEQRQRSRAGAKFSQDAMRFGQFYSDLRERAGVRSEFTGYGELGTDARILSLAIGGRGVEEAPEGSEAEVVLDRTPFYAEGGGQVGDRGHITTSEGRALIADTQSAAPEVTVMIGTVVDGVLRSGATARAEVDPELRRHTMRNHTATHLLHATLRRILGDDVHQAGSLVHAPGLRFDFTLGRALAPQEIRQVEAEVNRAILDNAPVRAEVMPLHAALASGALHLFDEKYSGDVRVVQAGPSRELCGGTHCHSTGDIGLFLITSEGSIGAGIRRIEALTGEGALRAVRDLRERAQRSAALLRVPEERIPDAVAQLVEGRGRLERELETTRKAGMETSAIGLIAKAETLDGSGARLVVANVGDADAGSLRALSDRVRDGMGSGVVVLGGARADRASLAIAVTKDLTPGMSADAIVRQVASIIGGSGGGQPHSATGGGKDVARLGEALEAARRIVREKLAPATGGEQRHRPG
ncbi:MAG: alanine--tRNA ligase [Chloroflexi bacterium]|nr:alanine--tRNA ligase [Chloroflexota bacterium]